MRSHFLQQLCKCLRLSAVQEAIFALALLHSSNPEIVNIAQSHLRSCIPGLVQSYIDTEGSSRQHEGGLHETSPEVLHLILSAILKSPKDLGLTNEIHADLLSSLQRDFPKDHVPVVLAPVVYPDCSELAPEMSSEGPGLSGGMLDTSLADLVSELGHGFTTSLEECRKNLMKLGGREITAALVARILSLMCRSHAGMEMSESRSSWNVEVFVQALKEIAPNLNWDSVIMELDHPDFAIKDRQGLLMLMTAVRLGLASVGFPPDKFPFPVNHIYHRWSNVEGQFGLIQMILKNPDVFSFSDYPSLSVPIDILKTPPEQDSKELANWRNVTLVELLLTMSELGLYPQVQELFKVPLQNCPDVLVLTLLQISGPVIMLRQELFTNLIPVFLGNHPNSAIILHHAWHTVTINIKHIIMHAMAEWYVRGDCDQTR